MRQPAVTNAALVLLDFSRIRDPVLDHLKPRERIHVCVMATPCVRRGDTMCAS
jgi:hypothetical protein